MSSVLSYVLAVVALGLLIALHEFGHLLAARMLGIRVSRYSVGIGPVLAEVRIGETSYALSAFPLGGYTRVVGMDPDDPEVGHADSYASRPVWQRLWVVIAGPLTNELLAVCLIFGVALVGMPDGAHTVLGRIEPKSPAAEAGLQSGDRLVALDGQALERFGDLRAAIHAHPGETVTLDVERGAETLHLTAKLPTPPVLGVAPALRRYPLAEAMPVALSWTFDTTRETLEQLTTAIAHPSLLQGPLNTVRATAEGAERGVDDLVFILALISLGLAIFNALPLPGLDGGRSLFLIFEGVTRRKVSPRLEGMIHGLGLLLILAAIVALSVSEIRGH